MAPSPGPVTCRQGSLPSQPDLLGGAFFPATVAFHRAPTRPPLGQYSACPRTRLHAAQIHPRTSSALDAGAPVRPRRGAGSASMHRHGAPLATMHPVGHNAPRWPQCTPLATMHPVGHNAPRWPQCTTVVTHHRGPQLAVLHHRGARPGTMPPQRGCIPRPFPERRIVVRTINMGLGGGDTLYVSLTPRPQHPPSSQWTLRYNQFLNCSVPSENRLGGPEN